MNDRPTLSRPVAIPQTRLSRLARLGTMASGVAGGMAVEGVRQLGRGERPELRDLLLTPSNISRVTDQLARMRGAAMKVGQLVSMDTGDVLPPELAQIMARLRAEADHMPPKQLKSVLTATWGPDWLKPFRRFDVRPIAAASIGQVHRAQTRDGRDLALKIQYPGVRRSIDSDVTNVGALIKVSGLLPPGLDMGPLLDEARKQLHEETDYAREGAQLRRFGALMADVPDVVLPELAEDLTTETVLAMSFVAGTPVEDMAEAPQEVRDRIGAQLIDLTLRELFALRVMQTDPNFANFLYDAEAGQLVLLDFGAARDIPERVVDQYRALMRAGLAEDRAALERVSKEIGFFAPDSAAHHKAAILDMIWSVFGALRAPGAFDFADPTLQDEMRVAGMALGADRTFAHVPPMDVLFVQRKFAGMFLLAARLGARVDVREVVGRYV
ncbi:MAG: AarF/ABC1/UbiB kinase family protein [Pseudomonadota bacterium]